MPRQQNARFGQRGYLASCDTSACSHPSSGPRFLLPPGRGLAGLGPARSALAGGAGGRSAARRIYRGGLIALGSSGSADTSLLQVGVFSPRCFCGRLALVVFFVSVLEAKISAAGSALHLWVATRHDRWVFVRAAGMQAGVFRSFEWVVWLIFWVNLCRYNGCTQAVGWNHQQRSERPPV